MTDERTEQEIAQLRDEVRRLRERQEQRNGDGDRKDDRPKEDKNAAEDRAGGEDEQQPQRHPIRKIVIIAVVLIVVVVGLLWWLHARHFEDTDDAMVDGHTSGIASRIAGNIVGVYAEENQFVKAGQVLVDLDPRDYKAALEQAQGQLQQARGQAEAEQPNVAVTEVTNATEIATTNSAVAGARAAVAAAEASYQGALEKISESEANNAKAQADVGRYRPLAEKDEVPHEQFDQVVATAKSMAATVAANRASANAAQRQVDESRQQLVQAEQRANQAVANAPRQIAIRRATVGSRHGAMAMALAQFEQAKLNLSYCKIVAPFSGIVSKRIAEVGVSVAPGQQLFLLTNLDDLWVTANFRETQLRRMHAGESVRIHVDSLAASFDGYLESLPAASGAVTSLLPPENATGNFVKIVQRLPVRIRFRKNQPGFDRLRPGMSVEPKVTVD